MKGRQGWEVVALGENILGKSNSMHEGPEE